MASCCSSRLDAIGVPRQMRGECWIKPSGTTAGSMIRSDRLRIQEALNGHGVRQQCTRSSLRIGARANTVHTRVRTVDFELQSLCSSATGLLYLLVMWAALPLSGQHWG